MATLKKIHHGDVRLIIMDHENRMAFGNGGTLFSTNEINELINYLENSKQYIVRKRIDVDSFNRGLNKSTGKD